jgi:hypothetical protein
MNVENAAMAGGPDCVGDPGRLFQRRDTIILQSRRVHAQFQA